MPTGRRFGLSLFGASYGSHLGLSIIRRHPEIVERAVLGGIEGPDQTIKLPVNVESHLSEVSRLIAADPSTGKLLPSFRLLLRKMIREVSLKQSR
jgi:pimeloyl-ACP methyl ester carboxylesterase